MDEREEEQRLQKTAGELQAAISTVLFNNSEPSQLRLANDWIISFLGSPWAWPASLYLAFPPQGCGLGLQQELSLKGHSASAASRLCVVIGAVAPIAGVDTCYELVASVVEGAETNAVESSQPDLLLKIDLLTSLAEETLHRGRSLSWMVRDCMQDCCPQVLTYLNALVTSCCQTEVLGKVFTCFERWIPAGVVLSEIYTDYGALFRALSEALKVPLESVFQPAVWALSELVSQVDVLPGREAAISALMRTILAQKWQYDAAAAGERDNESGGASVHARGLCLLLSEIGSVEAGLVCRSGIEGARILEWLVDASRGGGGLGFEGALMAVEAWPRLAAIPHERRGDFQPSVFIAAAQAILQAAKYPSSFEFWDDLSLEEEDFTRFRANAAEGALKAIYKELGGTFLSLILEILSGTSSWQDAEVCLYAAASISKEVLAAAREQNHVAISLLGAVYTRVLGSSDETSILFKQNERLVKTSVDFLKSYSEWTSSEGTLLQHSIHYVMSSFCIGAVRLEAAQAFKELCHKAASLLATLLPIDTLIGSCESALSLPVDLPKDEEMHVQVVVVQGLASVLSLLPSADAERGLVRLTFGAASTIKEVAAMGKGTSHPPTSVLESALNVVTAALSYGFQDGGQLHPALHLLQDIWPALEMLKETWAVDGVVAAALCDLWGTVASKVGAVFVDVVPGIVAAASLTFKLHKVAAPLSCLSKVVALAQLKHSPELENCLAAMLLDVTSMLSELDKVMDEVEKRSQAGNINAMLEMQDLPDTDFGSSLCMMYELGRSFLQYFPALILPSVSFSQVFASATGAVNRKDPDVALVAASFLLESLEARNDHKAIDRERRIWNFSPELLTKLDQVVISYGRLIVEAILRRLALDDVVESLKEALSDVLYGLCTCYPAITKEAVISTLSAADFPGRAGFKLDADKERFLFAALRQPPHPRVRFQEEASVAPGGVERPRGTAVEVEVTIREGCPRGTAVDVGVTVILGSVGELEIRENDEGTTGGEKGVVTVGQEYRWEQ
ncbi:hypothetical protein GOP47_0015394 [Adiantum capillus-veneris]|uniref:Uncharacterized protein n=2 Tax=Adiantum capillus-veneris TaxID=13818 RepID=A0A9D4UKK1_ADICA|nr:hypothetical protein GOP47_0015394 [Adiantum capillus-veneris]